MRLSQLTFLGFYLNSAQGKKKYDYLTIDKIKEELGEGNIFQYLQEEMGGDIDTSVLSNEEQLKLNQEWLDISLAVDESRKMGVNEGGVCLLVAYVFESIQRLNR